MPEYHVSLSCRVISDVELGAEALKQLAALHQEEELDEFLSRMDSEELA